MARFLPALRKYAFWLVALAVTGAPAFAQNGVYRDETLAVDGSARRFLVHNFSGQAPAPAVILLHGGGGSGANMASQTGFDTVAAREGLIAVYPYGSGALFDNLLLTWNAAHCCAHAMRENIDDVQFISLLIDYLIEHHNADPARVYVTGLSNGGMMSHRIGIELHHKVAAIAPVISSVFGDEPALSITMPTLIINGAEDERVKVAGGDLFNLLIGDSPADLPTLPVVAQGEYWAQANGCTTYTDSSTADYTLRAYANCRAGAAVQGYLVNGNGHAWPGGSEGRAGADPPVQTVNANELIWDFFRQYTRAAVPLQDRQAYFYDGNLQVPVLRHLGVLYQAQLLMTRSIPPFEFGVTRVHALDDASTASNLPAYILGILEIPGLMVGNQRYSGTLVLDGLLPMRFRVASVETVTQ